MDDFLKGMETEYDYHAKKGNLFKIKHLLITIQDYTYTNGWGIGSKQDYKKIGVLEKRLLEDSDAGKGYYLSKIEKRECNFIYDKYRIDGLLNKHPGLWAPLMIDSKELAEYISKRMKGCTVKGMGIDGEWLYIKKPFINELTFWIQQFKTKDCTGHSEWSKTHQRNIWISNNEEC